MVEAFSGQGTTTSRRSMVFVCVLLSSVAAARLGDLLKRVSVPTPVPGGREARRGCAGLRARRHAQRDRQPIEVWAGSSVSRHVQVQEAPADRLDRRKTDPVALPASREPWCSKPSHRTRTRIAGKETSAGTGLTGC